MKSFLNGFFVMLLLLPVIVLIGQAPDVIGSSAKIKLESKEDRLIRQAAENSQAAELHLQRANENIGDTDRVLYEVNKYTEKRALAEDATRQLIEGGVGMQPPPAPAEQQVQAAAGGGD